MRNSVHWLLRVLTYSLGALILFGGGFMAGMGYGFRHYFDTTFSRDATALAVNVDVLARYRVDGPKPALESLERWVDHDIVNLALPLESHTTTFDDLPQATRTALQAAKVYRTAYPPPKNADLQLIQALEKIPMPPVRTDSGVDSALRRIRLYLAEQAATRPVAASSTAPAVESP